MPTQYTFQEIMNPANSTDNITVKANLCQAQELIGPPKRASPAPRNRPKHNHHMKS